MVPDSWVIKNLGDIATISSGGTPSRSQSEYWGGDIPWVTTAEVNFGTITKTAQTITSLGMQCSSAKLFPKNTILMAMYGQGKTRGQVAKLGIEATTNQACAAITLKSGYSHEYLFQYLQSEYENIRGMSNGGGQNNLSAGLIKEIPLPVPPFAEQTKIAQILSTWDKAIATTERLLANSQQQKKALMQQLLTGQKRFAESHEEWRVANFSSLYLVKNDKKTQTTSSNYLEHGKSPIVDQGQTLIAGYTDSNQLYRDVPVIVFGDHTRAIKWVDFEFSPGADGTQILKASDLLEARFAYYLLSNADIPNLGYSRHMRELKEIDFRYPTDKVEQQKIAQVLSTADAEIANLQAQLDKLKLEKKALMQQLLTHLEFY